MGPPGMLCAGSGTCRGSKEYRPVIAPVPALLPVGALEARRGEIYLPWLYKVLTKRRLRGRS